MRVAKGIMNLAFWFLVGASVLMASTVLLAKAALPFVGQYRTQIERNLSQVTGMEVRVERVQAELNGIDVELRADGITVDTSEYSDAIRIGRFDLELDLAETLLTLSPQFRNVAVSDVQIALQERGNGQVTLRGVMPSLENSSASEVAVARVLSYISDQQQMVLTDVNIDLGSSRFDNVSFSIPATYLTNRRSHTLIRSDIFVNDIDDPIQLRTQISTDLTNFLQKQVVAYIQVPSLTLPVDWLSQPQLRHVKDITLAGEYWLTYQPNKGLTLQAQQSQFSAAFDDQQSLAMTGDWRVRRGNSAVTVATQGVELATDKTQFRDVNLKGEWEAQRGRGFFVLNQMDVELASELALHFIPEDWFLSRLLKGLQGQGLVENASLRLWQADEKLRYQYLSNVTDVSVEGFNGIPAVNNIHGVFSLSDSDGAIEFVTRDADLAFPVVFDRSWDVDQATGEVSWKRLDQAFIVQGRGLHLTRGMSTIQGGFRLEQPFAEGVGEPWLALDLNLQNLSTDEKFTYVPPKALPDSLKQWMNKAIGSGHVSQADLLLRTGLQKGDQPFIRLSVDTELEKLAFDPAWPAVTDVTGQVTLDGDGVSVAVDRANFVGLAVQNWRVGVPLVDNKAEWVSVSGQWSGASDQALAALSQTPLQDTVLEPFSNWQITGDIAADLRLQVPLTSKENNPDVDLGVKFQKGTLFVDQINLPAQLLSGELHYETDSGLDGTHFELNALGGQSRVVLNSNMNPDGRFIVDGTVSGTVATSELIDWRAWPALLAEHVSGKMVYQGNLAINRSQAGQVDVNISSGLQGVAIDFPEPVKKAAETTQRLNIQLKSFEKEILLDIAAQRLVYAKLLLDSDGIQGGDVSLFKPLAPTNEMKQGIALKGQTDVIDWHMWEPYLKASPGTSNEQPKAVPLTTELPKWVRSIDVLIDRVPINSNNQLSNAKLTFDRSQDGHPLMLTSDELNAVLRTTQTGKPELHIAYLNWRTNSDKSSKNTEESSFEPSIIPSMALQIDEIYIDNRPYGDWRADIVNLGRNVRIENVSTALPTGNFDGDIFWQGGTNPNVVITMKASGDKAQELTRKFSSTPFIQSDRYNIDVALSWSDSLLAFTRESLNGRIRFNIEDGNFNQVDQLPPFLRVLGIFNVDALAKRLTFDFSDLYEPGMPFDRFSSTLEIKNGLLNTVEPLRVSSPTAEITLEGTANLINETLNERLTATIPITSSLPVAGLLLGTPQIAGILYITDKLIGDQISKVTSIQYQIEGPFSEPVVTPVRYRPRN